MLETTQDFALEDLHNFRRLRQGCPVYGDFSFLQAERPRFALIRGNIPNCGYYHPQLGRFMPFPA
jgi:hypothetical protein